MTTEITTDIAIVGSGLVGQAAALALQPLGFKLALFEASEHRPVQDFDPAQERYLALNAHSLAALSELGVRIDPSRSQAIREVLITRLGEFGQIRASAASEGLTQLGALVPASVLSAALDHALHAQGVARNFAKKLDHIDDHACLPRSALVEDQAQGLRLHFADQSTAVCRLLIGADGSDSQVRSLSGMAVHQRDYPLQALVCNVGISKAHHGIALERFTDTGPIAVLPLPGLRCGVVWSLPNELAEATASLTDADFCQRLHSQLGYRLGRIGSPSKRQQWPLRALRVDVAHAHRRVLLGNAALTVHPLGAQGFNLGLRDVMALKRALQTPGALDSSTVLRDYSEARQVDRANTLRFSDQTLIASSAQGLFARALRQSAFAGFNLLPLAQRELLRFGLGFVRD